MLKFDVNGKTGFSGGANEVRFAASKAMRQRRQKFCRLIRNPERFFVLAGASISVGRQTQHGRF
jgi:hypothetical protein